MLSEAVVVGGWQGRQSPWWLDASRAGGGRGAVCSAGELAELVAFGVGGSGEAAHAVQVGAAG